MGETGCCRPPERPTYPGLVRPYSDENDYVNQPNFIVNKMSKMIIPEHDPFSIYDDDSAHDHYFFLPAGKLDLNNFKKTASLRESNRSNCGNWSRTKPAEERSLKKPILQTTSHCHCQCKMESISHTESCQKQRGINIDDSKRNLIENKNKRTSNGEYCSLAKDAVAPIYPGIACSSTPIDEENFRKYAFKLICSDSSCSSSDINQNSNTHIYHNPPRTKIDNRACRDKHINKMKNSYKMDKYIDRCTCMICIKAGSYHWASDKDSYIEEPCSCMGSRKNIVLRWLCFGVVALFLPCLICYLPAKYCQNRCCEQCPRSRLKSKHCHVKYVNKEPDDNMNDNGLS